LAYLGLLEAAAVVVQEAKVLVVEAMAPQVPAMLQRLQQQIQVAGVEAGLAASHLTPVGQVAQVSAACGGLNKENNDELCTYQQQFG
jgi:hypothetical protein